MKPVGIKSYALSCALGNNQAKIWQAACAGSTVGLVKDNQLLFEGTTHIGRVNNQCLHDIEPFFDCRVNQLLADVALQLNLPDIKQAPAEKIGVIIGTSTSGVDEFEQGLAYFDRYGKWAKDYQFHQQRMANVSEFLATYLDARGPVMSVSTACSSGAKALLSAQRWLNSGFCDVVVAGGVDVLCQLTINGFNALGALSEDKCLPFSQNRQGINIGEGAALFVLTREIADLNLMGGGESSDAHHISAPDPTGQGAIDAMQGALRQAQVMPWEVDYLNLHGTGTPQNDVMEAKAVNQVFSGHNIKCSSTKGMTGHTLGAAGALELGYVLCLCQI